MLIAAGIGYMVVLGHRCLPYTDPLASLAPGRTLPDVYELRDRLWEVQIPPTSLLVGQTLATADLGEVHGVTVLGCFHGQSADVTPGPDTVLHADDVLLVAGRDDAIQALPGVTIDRRQRTTGYFNTPDVLTAEVIIAPRAAVRGHTLKQLAFRRRYGVTVVAVWHNGHAHRTHIGDLPLQPGDALLVVGARDQLARLGSDADLVLATQLPDPLPRPRANKRRIALLITALVLGLSTAQQLPISIAVLLGVVLFVLTGALTMDEALGAIEWKTVFVIAGMLPLSIAMQKTGLAATIGTALVATIGGYGFVVLAGGLYLGTTLLTQVLGGQVTALVMGPIAVAAAMAVGVSPRAVGVVVAIACSSTFLTPLAHPVNLLVVGPGGYTFRDFARVGLGLTLTCFVVLVVGSRLLPSG